MNNQYNIIMKAMLSNKEKVKWTAKDFQKEPYFVGYEASARMSELMDLYYDILEVGRDGRFRTLSIKWENVNDKLLEKFTKEES